RGAYRGIPLEDRGRLLSWPVVPRQGGGDGPREIRGPEGLSEHGRAAGVLEPPRNVATPGQDQGREPWPALARPADQREAAPGGPPHVHQEQIDRRIGREHLERRGPAVGKQRLATQALEAILCDRTEVRIVVDHQDRRARSLLRFGLRDVPLRRSE